LALPAVWWSIRQNRFYSPKPFLLTRPDDNHIWWNDFQNEKHLLHIPNADHPLNFLPPSAAKVRKTASFFEFSLCLSRACLGKMIV
jgi:hypothetical protein